MAELSLLEWDQFISQVTNPHILQTSPWGQLKTDFGWDLSRVASNDCGAQILFKRFLPGINLGYIPKGPIGLHWEQLLPEIDDICRKRKCIFLKVEPDLWVEVNTNHDINKYRIPKDFIPSQHSIQPLRTLLINISRDETQILARMKQKTRYNINLALKKNVAVKPYTDLSAFYDLMKITGQRDQFGIHSLAYYQRAYDLFHERDLCQLLVAEFDGSPISALIAFRFGNRAWYFYGASSNLHRDKMPNYLLQWEAIRWAKSQGCSEYDLWGVPDFDLSILEEKVTSKSDGLWGVYRFKRGFGGELQRSAGPWDRIYNPFLYRLYSLWFKFRKNDG
jgi:peptidoglycan pentaglycine glycine transferase (the first glycine)